MPTLNKEDYVLRIASATPVQLVIINHELLIMFLENAQNAHDNGDMEEFGLQINKVKSALEQLINGLDFKIEIALQLYDLYLYAGERINQAFFKNSSGPVAELREMFGVLLEGWREIENTPDERANAASTDAPKVYSGLTYGKDGPSEYVERDETRDYII